MASRVRPFAGSRFAGPLMGVAGQPFRDLSIEGLNIGPNWVYRNDFLSQADYDETGDWAESTIGAGGTADIVTDVAGGVLRLDAGANGDAGIQAQFTAANAAGEFVVPADGKEYAFFARFRKSVAAGGAIFVGLASTLDPAIAAATGVMLPDDFVGFYTGESSASLVLAAERANGGVVTSSSMATLTDDGWVEAAFHMKVDDISSATANGTIAAYLRGGDGRYHLKATIAQENPNVGMCITLIAKNNPAATVVDLDVDAVVVSGQR